MEFDGVLSGLLGWHATADIFSRWIGRNLCGPGPLQARIETVADDSDLEDVYNTERHLLYVACTRARDQLLDTSVEPASEFLEDLLM
jgi:superfamily I DNA/RNA helicase